MAVLDLIKMKDEHWISEMDYGTDGLGLDCKVVSVDWRYIYTVRYCYNGIATRVRALTHTALLHEPDPTPSLP